jgi:hypothetical protein
VNKEANRNVIYVYMFIIAPCIIPAAIIKVGPLSYFRPHVFITTPIWRNKKRDISPCGHTSFEPQFAPSTMRLCCPPTGRRQGEEDKKDGRQGLRGRKKERTGIRKEGQQAGEKGRRKEGEKERMKERKEGRTDGRNIATNMGDDE